MCHCQQLLLTSVASRSLSTQLRLLLSHHCLLSLYATNTFIAIIITTTNCTKSQTNGITFSMKDKITQYCSLITRSSLPRDFWVTFLYIVEKPVKQRSSLPLTMTGIYTGSQTGCECICWHQIVWQVPMQQHRWNGKNVNGKIDNFWFIIRIIFSLSMRLLFSFFWTLIEKHFRFTRHCAVHGNFVGIPSPFATSTNSLQILLHWLQIDCKFTANLTSSPLPHPPCQLVSAAIHFLNHK